jgi:hypothetical protein
MSEKKTENTKYLSTKGALGYFISICFYLMNANGEKYFGVKPFSKPKQILHHTFFGSPKKIVLYCIVLGPVL